MDYKSMEFEPENIPFFLWDNYIHLFAVKFPNLIEECIMITQNLGDFVSAFEDTEHKGIWQLDSILPNYDESNWILNIDIDFFFNNRSEEEDCQMFTDKYITQIGQWVANKYDRFEQITIALSPDCCGGWDNSIRVANIFLSPLKLKIDV